MDSKMFAVSFNNKRERAVGATEIKSIIDVSFMEALIANLAEELPLRAVVLIEV